MGLPNVCFKCEMLGHGSDMCQGIQGDDYDGMG